ncbi:hypothetical protein [Flavobacterium sp.]|uniref:hypothetical protein n=1 Tax=Flavobacterium sp. TaxID=239 RepID=UPI0037520EE0
MNIEKLLAEIKAQLLELLKENYKDFVPQLENDITNFLKQSKVKLERWTLLLVDKSLTQDDFEWLVKSQKNLLVLEALQTAGLSKIKLNNLKNSIIKVIINTTAKAVLVGL